MKLRCALDTGNDKSPGCRPFGDNPGWVLVLDVKDKQGAVLARGKQHSVVMGEHELGDGGAAASEFLELPI